jgi:hypothetical protein
MSTQSPARRERFRLDQDRLAARVIADEHFGVRKGAYRGYAPGVVSRFGDAVAAKAILGPEGVEPRAYVIAADLLVVVVRAREAPSQGPRHRTGDYAIANRAVAYVGDESFGECCRVIETLLEYADDLVVSTAILFEVEGLLGLPMN